MRRALAGKNKRRYDVKRLAYVGCRSTRERDARGNGIEVYEVNDITGEWRHAGTVPARENPSYLAFDSEKKYLYAVHGDTDEMSAFSLDAETGMPVYLNTVTLGGSNPVYLVPDPSNRYMIVACLGTGNIVAVGLNGDGSLGKAEYNYVFPGNEGEQKTTCPHQVYYDNSGKYLIVSCKGVKKTTIPAVMGLAVFNFSPEKGFELLESISGRNFDHCRHVAVHPGNRFVYQVNELQNSVISLYLDNSTGQMTPFQVISTLPDHCVDTRRLLASGICMTKDGRYVFVSNRGHDSIAIYSADQKNGRLTSIGWMPTMGRQPRFIGLDPTGHFLYAANEKSDTIEKFIVEDNGFLTYNGQASQTGSPVCIVFG
jgi:6-phosphogluconolactonase (cycloisomerase 2 family)